jgi:hypothetical protein
MDPPPPIVGSEDQAFAELNDLHVAETIIFTCGKAAFQCRDQSLIYGVGLQDYEIPIEFQLSIEQSGIVCATITGARLDVFEYNKHCPG